MQKQPVTADKVVVARSISHPSTWLVFGMEWPEEEELGPFREAAFALAPALVPAERATPDVAVVLSLALEYAAARSSRVVFFSDLTRYLAEAGLKWRDVGVESWVETKDTMRSIGVPGLYVSVSYRAHAYLCDASWEGITWQYTDGTTEHDPTEKDRVRAAFQARLEKDWPPYIEEIYAKCQVTEYER